MSSAKECYSSDAKLKGLSWHLRVEAHISANLFVTLPVKIGSKTNQIKRIKQNPSLSVPKTTGT